MTQEIEVLFEEKYRSKISSTVGRVDKLGNPIEVRLSLEEFRGLYESAGVLPMFPYLLSRVNDEGHYEIGNVFISTSAQNSLDFHGMSSENDMLLTKYCYKTKYKRRVVKKALKSGKLTWGDIVEMKPITLND